MIDYTLGIKIAALLFTAAVCWAWIGVMLDARRPRKNRHKPRVRTVLRSEHDKSIIGDGAWSARPPHGPSARARREPEPRGM